MPVYNFQKDSTKVFSMLGGSDSGKKLSFHAGCSSSGLSLRATGNMAKIQEEYLTICRKATVKVIGMRGIHKTN